MVLISMRLIIVFVLTLFFLSQVSTEAQEIPDLSGSPEILGRLEGMGTHFELTNSEYLNIILDSSEPIKLVLESIPEMVTLHIEPASVASSTEITLSGFLPQTTYHKYEDDYHNHVEFMTDAEGTYTYSQDLSQEHFVFIQTRPSTVFISESRGWSNPTVGRWDRFTKTAVLTQDLTETIQIDDDGITLDGNGHTLIGSNSGYAVFLNRKSNVTIKNLNIQNFGIASFLAFSYI